LEQCGGLFDKAVTGPAREPQSSVAQSFQLGSGTRRDIALAVAQSRAPNTNATQVHLRLLIIPSGARNRALSVIPSGARNLSLQREIPRKLGMTRVGEIPRKLGMTRVSEIPRKLGMTRVSEIPRKLGMTRVSGIPRKLGMTFQKFEDDASAFFLEQRDDVEV